MAYSLANIANYAELRSLFPGSEIHSNKTGRSAAVVHFDLAELYSSNAGSILIKRLLDIFGRDGFYVGLNFVLCCGSLTLFACAQFGVSILKRYPD